jgi:hypothetical protein
VATSAHAGDVDDLHVDTENGQQPCAPGALGVLGRNGDGHAAAAGAAAFLGAPCEQVLLSGGDDRRLMVWDVGRCLQGCCDAAVCSWSHRRKVNAVSACRSGRGLFAVADTSPRLTLYTPLG